MTNPSARKSISSIPSFAINNANKLDQLPKAICRMRAKFAYEKENSDEIDLSVGNILDVNTLDVDGDEGWAKGFNIDTRMYGIFPIDFCKLIVSQIPKPIKHGVIYDVSGDFTPREGEDDCLEISRGDFVELLPADMQNAEDLGDGWSAVYHCTTQKTGLVPSNYIKKVGGEEKNQKRPRLSVYGSIGGLNSGSNNNNSANVNNNVVVDSAKLESGANSDFDSLGGIKYFRIKAKQIPEYEEDLELEAGEYVQTNLKSKLDPLYFGSKVGQKQMGFIDIDICESVSKEEALNGGPVDSKKSDSKSEGGVVLRSSAIRNSETNNDVNDRKENEDVAKSSISDEYISKLNERIDLLSTRIDAISGQSAANIAKDSIMESQESFSDKFNELRKEIDEQKQTVGTLESDLSSKMQQILSDNDEKSNSIDARIVALQTFNQDFGSKVESIDSIEARLTEMNQKIDNIASIQSENINNMQQQGANEALDDVKFAALLSANNEFLGLKSSIPENREELDRKMDVISERVTNYENLAQEIEKLNNESLKNQEIIENLSRTVDQSVNVREEESASNLELMKSLIEASEAKSMVKIEEISQELKEFTQKDINDKEILNDRLNYINDWIKSRSEENEEKVDLDSKLKEFQSRLDENQRAAGENDANLNSMINEFNTKIDELQRRFEELNPGIEKINERINKNENSVREMSESVNLRFAEITDGASKSNSNDVNDLKENYESLKQLEENLNVKSEQQTDALKMLKDHIENTRELLDQKIESLKANQDNTDASLASQKSIIDKTTADLEDIRNISANDNNRNNSDDNDNSKLKSQYEAKISELNAKLQSYEERFESINSSNKDVTSQIAKIEKQFEQLLNQQQKQEEETNRIKQSVSENVTSTANNVSSNTPENDDNAIEKLKKAIKNLASKVVDTESRIKELSNTSGDGNDKLKTLDEALENFKKETETSMKSFNRKVSSMRAQIMSISEKS